MSNLVKWRTSFATIDIERIECDRESLSSVWVLGEKKKKMSEWTQYHDSWDDAKEYLRGIYRKKRDSAERSAELARDVLRSIEEMEMK